MSNMDDQVEFWMVWNPAGHSPTMRHYEFASAQREADRLARAHREHQFYILKAIEYVTVSDLVRVRLAKDEAMF